MKAFMNDDPISKLPEPYRVAWEILHEPFDYEHILRRVLTSAQKIANANWGMMVLDVDIEGLDYRLPGFRTLPDILDTTIPIGYVSSLAYALARKVIQDSQSILIADINSIAKLETNQLIDDYLPISAKEKIMNYAKEQWFASRLLEIPPSTDFTIMAVPIIVNGKVSGAMYLHRSTNHGAFTDELLEEVRTFLSLVGVGIKNAKSVMDVKDLALQFPFILSTELRTPLIAIHGFAKLLHDYSTGSQDSMKTDVDITKFSKIIMDNVDRMRSLLDGLLVYARIEQNWITKQGVKPNDILNPVIEKYRVLTQEKNQTIVLDIADIQDVEVCADHFLSEVVDVLIKNAHLYTPEGGEVRITASIKDKAFQFGVSDTGYGLTEEEIPQLFQRFYRSPRSEIRIVSGNGMGLFLAKRLVELWGGQMGAKGSLNQGSTFWFAIPLKKG